MTGPFVEAEEDLRMTGVRVDYRSAPPALHAWVEDLLGSPVVEVVPRTGGMSPAVAVSLRSSGGARVFVKAVSSDVNPDTPSHFRHEIAVLTALPPAPYRAELMSTYDDGHWVGIALEDVDGRHPDWASAAERQSVLDAVTRQTAELTPVPEGMPPDLHDLGLVRYLATMRDPTPEELVGLPAWAAAELPRLIDLTQRTLDNFAEQSFCHWDIRHDNILVRHRDGQPVLLDWGMSRRGQHYVDAMVFGLEWVDGPTFDTILESVGLSDAEQADVTGFLAGIGSYLAMVSTHRAPPGLPNLPAFRRRLATACLTGVRRRLA